MSYTDLRFFGQILLSALFVLSNAACHHPGATSAGAEPRRQAEWRTDFGVKPGDFTSTGRNDYFILEPGYEQIYQSGREHLTIRVLSETRVVDGVETRIVEEREEKGGKLVEVSRNFFAIDKRTNDAYYFGEEVDMYRDGQIRSHDGGWLAGVKGAKFGLIMPAHPKVGDRYYQEQAPHQAMDRAEIVSVSETLKTPAGSYSIVVKIKETTPIEADVSYKWYAAGVGLIRDDSCELIETHAGKK